MLTSNIYNVIKKLTGREKSLFLSDINAQKTTLSNEIKGKSVLVIG